MAYNSTAAPELQSQ